MISKYFTFENNPISFQVCDDINVYNDIHSFAHIIYGVSGEVDVQVRDTMFKLKPDDLIFINPNEFHDILAKNSKYLKITIDYAHYDQKVIPTIPFFDCNSVTIKGDNEKYLKQIKTIIARYVQYSALHSKTNAIAAKSLSYELLFYLMTYFKVDIVSTGRKEGKREIVEKILKYVSDNYSKDISLVSLAEEFHFTPQYMSKLFKQEVGINFLAHLQDLRIRHVHWELSHRKASAEELAEKHGFPNTRSLLTCFKNKYGISFSDYKKQLPEEEDIDPIMGVDSEMSSDLNILSKNLIDNSQQNESINEIKEVPTINLNSSPSYFRHNYKYQIGMGLAKELLDPINQSMLKEAVSEIGFKYVSFHGLLDDDMMVYSEDKNGKGIHSFYYIDQIIDFILSIGAKPIIELSYMPSKLAKTTAHTMFYRKSYISLPKDYNKWDDLIFDLFTNLVYCYGFDEVSTWPIQIWSNPDTGLDAFGLNGFENYVELFLHTFKTIKKVIPHPSMEYPKLIDETLSDKKYMENVFNTAKKYNVELNAINVSYFGVSKKNVSKDDTQTSKQQYLLSSKDALKEIYHNIKNTLDACGKSNLIIRLSEWNSSISHRNLINDTAYKAPYIVRNVLQNIDTFDSMGYWTLIDTIETQPPKQIYHGGLGLYARNGIKKAAYYGFWALSRLGNEYIAKGDGYFVTKKNGVIQLLLYNYHHINNLYMQGEMFNMTETNRYSAFTQATNVKFTVPIEGFEDGEYLIKNTSIDQENTSSFDNWVKMGCMDKLSKDDEEYIKAISIPQRKYYHKEAQNSQLILSQILKPHEIRLIEIIKK